MTDRSAGLFEEASAVARAHAGVAASTMMGLPCLRVRGAFFAARDHRSGDLIVKLPRHRVQQLVATGAGTPFAPAGKVFREWVVIEDRDRAQWAKLIDEAHGFAQREQR